MRHFKLEFSHQAKDIRMFCFSPSQYGEYEAPAMIMFRRCRCETCAKFGENNYEPLELGPVRAQESGIGMALASLFGGSSFAMNVLGFTVVELGAGRIKPIQITEEDQAWLKETLGKTLQHDSFTALMSMVDEALTDAALSKLVGE